MVKKQENQDIVLTAEAFIDNLKEFKTEKELKKLEKYFKGEDKETQAFGVKFGDVFKIAKKYQSMSIEEIEKLLKSKYYEIRMGAVSIIIGTILGILGLFIPQIILSLLLFPLFQYNQNLSLLVFVPLVNMLLNIRKFVLNGI